MEYLQAVLLAVIQGAAELLPVSSSAHVILAQKLMGLDPSDARMVFLLVMLHTGTMGAVLVYFWPRWRLILSTISTTRFTLQVVLATLATVVLGFALMLLLEKITGVELEKHFKNLPLIAAALGVAGLLILISGTRESRAQRTDMTLLDALYIGLVQGICLPFRGLSRSGATISTGLLLGLSRRLAEDFSFALAVLITPPVIVRSVLKLRKEGASQADLLAEIGPGLVGMVCSFLAGLLALRLLSSALEHGRWKYFGYYCLGAAGVILAAHFAGY